MKDVKISWKNLRGQNGIVTLTEGNRKLVSSEKTRFIIWNLPCRITCPYATAHCLCKCYAKKAEDLYPDSKPSRVKNLKFSHTADFVPFMIDSLHYICGLKAYRTADNVVVRIHESGDFYNQQYADNWIRIAEACADIPNLVFMAYTKSLVFFRKGYPENMRIRGSIWDDTAPAQLALMEEMDVPTYTVITPEEFEQLPDAQRCRCEDCGTCGKCWSREPEHKHLRCKLH